MHYEKIKVPTMKSPVLSLIPIAAIAAAAENPYSNYPSVAKTATINGFADKVYDTFPQCARECVKQNTGNTPCPYWDIGCLCVMPQWNSPVAQCIAQNCAGADVSSASNVAVASCSAAGVWLPYWIINDAASAALSSAGQKQVAASTTSDAAPTSTTSDATPASTSAAPTTAAPTTAPSTSAVPSSSAQSSSAPQTSNAGSTAVSSSSSSWAATSSGTIQSSGSSMAPASSAKPSGSASSSKGKASSSSASVSSTVVIQNCTSCQTSSVGPSIITSANGVAKLYPGAFVGAVAAVAAMM